MKTPLRTISTGLLLAAALLCATPAARSAVTLADLLAGGTIVSGDKIFFNFHDLTQVGDLNVPTTEIFVDPVIGGPGPGPETEVGIRFSSALWTLTGENKHYDFGLDFNVRRVDGLRCITDNTLEITGGFVGSGRAQIAEGVLDHLTGATLANKLVFFDSAGEQLFDHEVFPGGPYVELEISKDFAMSTAAGTGARVFVSHFDQTFSQCPEGGPGLMAAFTVLGMLGWAGRGRFRQMVR